MTAPKPTKKSWRKRKPATASTMRQRSWTSDEIFPWLSEADKERVRRNDLQLNLLEPEWRAPRR